jgi:hypothetical protein
LACHEGLPNVWVRVKDPKNRLFGSGKTSVVSE